MGIDESDIFSIRWITRYENSLNFYCVLKVEAYENVFTSDASPMVIALGNLKSKIRMELSNGETYYDMSYWQQSIVSGIHGMQEFVMCILKGMRMDEDEALDTTFEITEALEECNFNSFNDPRMN
jgi:hypothetical protein